MFVDLIFSSSKYPENSNLIMKYLYFFFSNENNSYLKQDKIYETVIKAFNTKKLEEIIDFQDEVFQSLFMKSGIFKKENVKKAFIHIEKLNIEKYDIKPRIDRARLIISILPS